MEGARRSLAPDKTALGETGPPPNKRDGPASKTDRSALRREGGAYRTEFGRRRRTTPQGTSHQPSEQDQIVFSHYLDAYHASPDSGERLCKSSIENKWQFDQRSKKTAIKSRIFKNGGLQIQDLQQRQFAPDAGLGGARKADSAATRSAARFSLLVAPLSTFQRGRESLMNL